MRVFLTGDIHIGMRYAGRPRGAELAAMRVEALAGMVARADEEGCELLVVAGDLFHSLTHVERRDVERAAELLAGSSGTTLVLPGNHDWWDPDGPASAWRTFEAATRGSGVVIMSEARPYELALQSGRAVVYPVPCRARWSSGGGATTWIAEEGIAPDAAYRIGVAHGTIEGHSFDREGRYSPMSMDELLSVPVDAWMIGHAHVPFPHGLGASAEPCGRVLCAGTHMQTGASCASPGACLIVEIGAGGGQKDVRARLVETGPIRFHRRVVEVAGAPLAEALARSLADLPDLSVVDVEVGGALSSEDWASRGEIIEAATSRFFDARWGDEGATRMIDAEALAEGLTAGSFAARWISQLMDDPVAAQMAYELVEELGGR